MSVVFFLPLVYVTARSRICQLGAAERLAICKGLQGETFTRVNLSIPLPSGLESPFIGLM